MGAEVRRELHGIRADATGRPDDQHAVALAHPSGPERLERGERRDGHGGGLLDREVRGARGQPLHGDDGQLGERPPSGAVHGVPHDVVGHTLADRLDGAGDVAARRAVAGSAEPEGEPGRERNPRHGVPRPPVDPGGADPHEHLARRWHGVGHLVEAELLGAAVPVLHDRLHGPFSLTP